MAAILGREHGNYIIFDLSSSVTSVRLFFSIWEVVENQTFGETSLWIWVVCYVFLTNDEWTKLDKGAVWCIFVGYDNCRKGWQCDDPIARRTYISRDVIFYETSLSWSVDGVLLDTFDLEDQLQNCLKEEDSKSGRMIKQGRDQILKDM